VNSENTGSSADSYDMTTRADLAVKQIFPIYCTILEKNDEKIINYTCE